MKYQALQAKRQFRAEFFYQIRMTNEHDFDIATLADFVSSLFRLEPFQKMPVLPFKTPAATFLTDIETKFTNNTKKHKIWHRSKFRHSDFQHKKPNFD